MTAIDSSVYTAVPTARRQSTASSTTIMPTIINTAPTARGTTRPRKSDTDVTSPSTRWISSPGVCWRWNSWSSPSTCRASRRRIWFVVRHAVIVANHDTATVIACEAMAMTRKATARRMTAALVVPSAAWSTMRRTTSGPPSASAEPIGQEHAQDAPTRCVGAEEGEQGAPPRRRRRGHTASLPRR